MSQLYWPKAQMECNKLEEGEKNLDIVILLVVLIMLKIV